jgi:hypothetical protein
MMLRQYIRILGTTGILLAAANQSLAVTPAASTNEK